jgi:hypothetical protein
MFEVVKEFTCGDQVFLSLCCSNCKKTFSSHSEFLGMSITCPCCWTKDVVETKGENE